MTSDHPERRQAPRVSSNTEAVVVSEGGLSRKPAKIRNVSPIGALVELPNGASLTDDVYLLLPGHQLQPIKPVWRQENVVGVQYPCEET